MAFNDSSASKIGTKGSDVYTANGVNDPCVALSVLLVQGADASNITSGLDAILATGDWQMVEDAFVLAFQTRDVRGGKGIRDVTRVMMNHLLSQDKWRGLMLELLEFVPEYGSWRDLKMLVLEAYETAPPYIYELSQRVLDLFEQQLTKDSDMAEHTPTKVSLAAKYAPRECHKNKYEKTMAGQLAGKMFYMTTPHSNRLKSYRQLISRLNKVLDTTEVKMCGHHFADIEPGKVPGRCLQKNLKAFLNEPSTYKTPEHPRPSTEADRITCAEHFTEHMAKAAKGEAKVNGSKTVFPHELIKKVVYSQRQSRRYYYYDSDSDGEVASSLTRQEKDTIVGVWNQMVKDAKAGGGLGRSIAMCDFSGSMQSSGSNGDTPYWVSMALGLLISEVTTKEFEDTFLTFDSSPTFHTLPKGDIFQRVNSIGPNIGQGTSTDFQKAMDLVLQRLKATRCRPGEEPENLIVLTDMNWDQAVGSDGYGPYTANRYRHVVKTDPWQTHVEMIRESFKRAGEDMWGEPLKMPRIVIWNIAASSTDFHAQSDTEGVVMLSGWSPSLFKVLQKDGVVIQTPYAALRAQLDDERYEPIRKRVNAWLRF